MSNAKTDSATNRAADPTAAPILTLDSVSKSFGGIHAVRDVSFALAPNRLTGLIGPNGAGKTTLFNLIAGVLRPDGGTIAFAGAPLNGLGAGHRARLGLGRSFQGVMTFPGLSVREHLVRACLFPAIGRPGNLWRRWLSPKQREQAHVRANDILHFMALESTADDEAASLPYGLQKLVGLGMTLATSPRMILADEPAAGLNAAETETMARTLAAIRAEFGMDILLIEHDLRLVMGICDRIIALSDGALIADGPPQQVRHDENFITAYLGDAHEA